MIEAKVDPRGSFRVMCDTADVHNHRANCNNKDNIPPLTKAKGELGDIKLLRELLFNEDKRLNLIELYYYLGYYSRYIRITAEMIY